MKKCKYSVNIFSCVEGGFDFSDHDNCPSPSCPVEYPLCLEIAPNPNAEVFLLFIMTFSFFFFEVNSWDNFHMALLNIFWVISLEQWVNSMYMLQDAYHPQVWIFFYVVTALVAFFALNLCLAVIEEALEEAVTTLRVLHIIMHTISVTAFLCKEEKFVD